MASKLSKVLIVFVLVCAIGGHWVVLQSIAWFGMAVSYSQDAPLKEALAKTFDGKHPCGLCKLVQEGKKSEKKQQLVKLETKLDFWLTRNSALLYPPPRPAVFADETDLAQPLAESPPVPPPRAA